MRHKRHDRFELSVSGQTGKNRSEYELWTNRAEVGKENG